MGVFDFIRKSDADVPPDVGKEDMGTVGAASGETAAADGSGAPYDPGELSSTTEDSSKKPAADLGKASAAAASGDGKSDPLLALKIERMDARIESINAMLKSFTERFTNVSQQIGEIRGMSLSNEKATTKLSAETARAIDVVNTVKPEQIRFDYQKLEGKIEELSGRIDSNKEFLDNLLAEMKELRRKADSFVGSEGLLRLQEDVKKDLMNIQQVSAKAKMHADKVEQLFIETQKMSNEYNHFVETLHNFEGNYSFLKKDLDKIKLDFTAIATKKDIMDMKKRMESKLSLVDGSVSYIEKMKNDNDRILRLLEETVSLSKKNEREIVELGMTVGNDKLLKVGEYDAKLKSLLAIIDTLAGQISELKKRSGMNARAPAPAREAPKPKALVLKNIAVDTTANAAATPAATAAQPALEAAPAVETAKSMDVEKKTPEESTATTPIEAAAPEAVAFEKKIAENEKATEVAPTTPAVEPAVEKKVEPAPTVEPAKPEVIAEKEDTKEQKEESAIPPAPAPSAAPNDASDRIVATPEILAIAQVEDAPEDAATEEVHELVDSRKKNRSASLSWGKPSDEFGELGTEFKKVMATLPSNELPRFNKPTSPDAEIVRALRKHISDSFGALDRSSKAELDKRYLVMKQMYDSLPKKDERLYRQILEFYNRLNSKLYTRVFS